MLHKVLLACAVLTAMAGICSNAQEQLTLDDAISIALKGNPGFRASLKEADAARIAMDGASKRQNPELIIAPSVIGEAGSDSAFLLAQPLEINGSRKARTLAAAGEAKAEYASMLAKRAELIRDVKIAYWDAAGAEAVVKLSEENVKFAETLSAAAKRQLDVGAAPGSHLIKTEVELARAVQDMRAAKAELSEKKSNLNTLLGRSPNTDFTTTGYPTYEPGNNDPIADNAGEDRPEIIREEALLSARKAEVAQAKAERRPDLSIQARIEQFGDSPGVGIGLTLPLIDWGSGRSLIRQSETAVQAQQENLEAQKNQIKLDIAKAKIRVDRAASALQEYQSGVLEKSEQLAQMAEKGYRAGAVSYLEVLEAQRTLRDVKAEYIAALIDYAKAKAELEWAVNSGKEESN